MIRHLSIQNIALIKNMSIDFSQGLTVLTGETGAGKSLFLDALCFVLGAKADKSLISHGESKARVDAIFDVNDKVQSLVWDNGYDCEGGELLISRTLTSEGRNEIRINGKIATLSVLRSITSHIVDIHGQNDQQSLLKTAIHIELIDQYGKSTIRPLTESVSVEYAKMLEIKRKIKGLGGTDFRPVFECVQRLRESGELTAMKGLIYFTDGEGVYPAKKPDYDTAFVFIDDEYTDFDVPPWAIKLVLKKDEI